jgi:hypothetical protein
MNTLEELTQYVKDKALEYLLETNENVVAFPMSIVDFVIEYAISECHFPKYFTESDIVSDLSKAKNKLAFACSEVYSRTGAEGEISHSENGVSRQYESTWISKSLLSSLPNYVSFL